MIPNGIYTFTNAAGEHRTFKIKTQKSDARFAPGKRIVALLRGPDNESDYTSFGFVEEAAHLSPIIIWNRYNYPKSPYVYYAKMVGAAALAIRGMVEHEEPKAEIELAGHKYAVQVSKRCLVCNRTLTDPESIRRQIGPICLGLAA